MVDAHLRSKTIETADIKNLIIGGQTGIDGIRFCLAAVTNGENLADPAFSWFLQYKNKNGQGESVGLTAVYENGLVKLPWIPNKLATQVPGRMQIQLYAAIVTGEGEAAVVDKQWVSEFAIIYIQENINPDPIVATEPSVIEYYVTLYAAYKNAAEAAAAAALESEQAAGTSEDNAADSAYAAEQAAIAAGDSASSAAQSAGLANTSKNAAAGSASEAAGSAAGALASKQAAATSETNAADHATEALASKNAAGVSEGNASDSKLKAQKWAEEAKDVEVEPGKFSAKHWMEKASGVYDNFDARFLGYKNADPAVDNKGNALVQGALYFNSVSKMLRLYNGTAWGDLANSAAGITYSGAGSGLEGTNVQTAIDELNEKKAAKESVEVLQLATARQETRANELEKTLNSTQGTTFDTTDIGTVVLPPNAAGRALINLKGLTARNLSLEPSAYAKSSNVDLIDGVFHFKSTGDAYIMKGSIPFNTTDVFCIIADVITISGGIFVFGSYNFTGFWMGTPVSGNLSQGVLFDDAPNTSDVYVSNIRIINLTAHFSTIPSAANSAKYFSRYFADTNSVKGPMRFKAVGKNLLNIGKFFALRRSVDGIAPFGTVSISIDGTTVNVITTVAFDGVAWEVPCKSGDVLTFSTGVAGNHDRYSVYWRDKDNIPISRTDGGILGNVTLTAPTRTAKAILCIANATSAGAWSFGQPQVEYGTAKTVYESYKSSKLYHADAEEYSSVPAVEDEIVELDGEYWKKQKVQRYVLQASDISSLDKSFVNVDRVNIAKKTDFIGYNSVLDVYRLAFKHEHYRSRTIIASTQDDVSSIGNISQAISYTVFCLYLAKGTYNTINEAQAALAGTVISYQLGIPLLTKLNMLGSLQSLRSITFEPFYQHEHLTDSLGKIILPYTGTIEAVYGYDESFTEYELAPTQYSLAGNVLTITGALEKEVFYVMMFRGYSAPIPQMTINSINSKTTIKDTTNGKYYELLPTITNGVLVGQTPIAVV